MKRDAAEKSLNRIKLNTLDNVQPNLKYIIFINSFFKGDKLFSSNYKNINYIISKIFVEKF